MNTVTALLLMLAAFTVGLLPIAVVILVMGFGGAPGAMLFAAGEKSDNSVLRVCGFMLAALGQLIVVGAYAVLVVALVRWISIVRPEIPTWSLWIAAFFHSGAAPMYAMKEKPERPTAQHHTLVYVELGATVVFFLAVFAPALLARVYWWVPLFDRLLQP